MGQKHSLQQKQEMKQTVSMQTVQFTYLLAMPANRLEEEVIKALEENPALEIDNDNFTDPNENDYSYSDDYDENSDELRELSAETAFRNDYPDFINEGQYEDDYVEDKRLDHEYDNINKSKDDEVKERIIADDSSLQEFLLAQLEMQQLTEREAFIAEYLLGSLDDQGFLSTDNKTYVSDLLLTYNIQTDTKEIENIIENTIHDLDPPGIGARNLKECFLIQLKRKEQTVAVLLAEKIVKDCFEELSKKHFDKIISRYNTDEKFLKKALHEIRKLDPSPGFSSSISKGADYITPDFIVEIEGNKIILSINNQYIPKLKINKDFVSQYRFFNSERNRKARADAERFLKENISHAQTLIDTLSQRELIMYNVMYSIIQRQKEYFFSGNDIDIKPMVLKDIAKDVGVDVSTVSRATGNKYVQTPYGTIPAKHLFSESIGNDDVSSRKIKELIAQFIAKENGLNPYTDDQICQYLTAQGHSVARRTIAKYRDQLHIPVARLRKKI